MYENVGQMNVRLGDKLFEEVDFFKYLGHICGRKWSTSEGYVTENE